MITIDWGNLVIKVPKTYMTVIQASPFEVRELDVNQFRLDLRALEASEDGIPFPSTHEHNTEQVLSGIAYARLIKIINGYTVEFEDGQYGVSLRGANNNILDVKVPNQVSVLANNSAGLVNSEEINNQSYQNGKVYINTNVGLPGTVFPKGSLTDPSDNFPDACIIAVARKLDSFELTGALTLLPAEDTVKEHWEGKGIIASSLTLGGGLTTLSSFAMMSLGGVVNGPVVVRNCAVSSLTNFQGGMTDCVVSVGVTLDPSCSNPTIFRNMTSHVPGSGRFFIDHNGSSCNLSIRGLTGGMNLRNITQNINASVDVLSGTVEIEASCTSGTIVLGGMVEVIDNSGPGCTVIRTRTVTELTGGTGSLTVEQATQLKELWQLQGLDPLAPMTVTICERTAGEIELKITGDGIEKTFVERV